MKKICENCGNVCPINSNRCWCGYRFDSARKRSRPGSETRSTAKYYVPEKEIEKTPEQKKLSKEIAEVNIEKLRRMLCMRRTRAELEGDGEEISV